MIIIADSGSTKCTWVAIKNGTIMSEITSAGINPYFQNEGDIFREITEHIAPKFPAPDAIHFYGAGCTAEMIPRMRDTLCRSFRVEKVEVNSDLVGAARSLWGAAEGIACILGTGSNSCQWDGTKITKQVAPGGFILGDEGSGAVMGKNFVADILKNQLPAAICQKFFDQYNLTPAHIIEHVYRQPYPSRFLANISLFMYQNIEVEEIRTIVYDCFSAFFRRCIMQYDTTLAVRVTGSAGYYFRDILAEAAQPFGIKIERVVQYPIDGLIEYHVNNQKTDLK